MPFLSYAVTCVTVAPFSSEPRKNPSATGRVLVDPSASVNCTVAASM